MFESRDYVATSTACIKVQMSQVIINYTMMLQFMVPCALLAKKKLGGGGGGCHQCPPGSNIMPICHIIAIESFDYSQTSVVRVKKIPHAWRAPHL